MTIPASQKIIGGKFGFPVELSEVRSHPAFLDGNPVLLLNARSGIKLVVDQLRPKNIWLPSYLCPTILSAIDRSISKIHYFPINSQLELSSLEFIDQINANDILLIIDYFGFPADSEILTFIQEKGCMIIKDCSQALFSDFHSDNFEFHLFSPRKFLGVPDGGILHISDHVNVKRPLLTPPPDEISYTSFKALIHRREFDLYGGDRVWRQEFNQVEEYLQPGYYRMSELSLLVLENAFNFEQICNQRRDNYLALSTMLSEIALFPTLPEDVIPLGFPIKLQNRDEVQRNLFSKNVYPPIHWNLDKFVPSEFVDSHELSQQIMTLPCDQRYDQDDMHFVAYAVRDLI